MDKSKVAHFFGPRYISCVLKALHAVSIQCFIQTTPFSVFHNSLK